MLALDIGRSRLTALRRMAARQQHGGMVSTHAADLRDFASMLARRRRLAAAGGGEAAQQAQQGPGEAAEAEAAGAAGSDGSDESAEDAGASRRTPWPAEFDRVLLDAPCSGTGVLAKRADLRWRRTPEEVEQMAGLQGQLLAAAASELGGGLRGRSGACVCRRRAAFLAIDNLSSPMFCPAQHFPGLLQTRVFVRITNVQAL